MKITLIFSGDGARMQKIVSAMELCWKKSGHSVTLLDVDKADLCGVTWSFFKGADLIVAGSCAMGLAGGYSSNLENFIKNCTFFEGRKVAVFVSGGLIGKEKALKSMMSLLEKQGAFIFDFETINRTDDGEKFAGRLLSAGTAQQEKSP